MTQRGGLPRWVFCCDQVVDTPGMQKSALFRHKWLPYGLLLPQLAVTLVFFIWPAAQALYQSLLIEDPFGLSREFAGLTNFVLLFTDPLYLSSFKVTIAFSLVTTIAAMGPALLLAVMADRVIKGSGAYRMILVWPYAVAPAVAGVLWFFMFNPTVGFSPICSSSLAMTGIITSMAPMRSSSS